MATDDKDKKNEPVGTKADKADAKDAAPASTAPVKVIVEGTPVIDPQAEADAKALADAKDAPEQHHPEDDPDPMVRAEAANICMVEPLGRDAKYVGLAVTAEADPDNAKGPDGLPLAASKVVYKPLRDVPFDPAIRIKDPATGEFYFATEATGWGDCELNGSKLIPDAPADPPAARSKKATAGSGSSAEDDEGSLGSGHKAPSAADQDKATKDAAHEVNKEAKK